MTCNWCAVSEKEKKYLLFQSQYWSVYLADEQDYIGRCILVCNRHCASLSELTIEEWGELGEIVKKRSYVWNLFLEQKCVTGVV